MQAEVCCRVSCKIYHLSGVCVCLCVCMHVCVPVCLHYTGRSDWPYTTLLWMWFVNLVSFCWGGGGRDDAWMWWIALLGGGGVSCGLWFDFFMVFFMVYTAS